jgi:hypothetical protein
MTKAMTVKDVIIFRAFLLREGINPDTLTDLVLAVSESELKDRNIIDCFKFCNRTINKLYGFRVWVAHEPEIDLSSVDSSDLVEELHRRVGV